VSSMGMSSSTDLLCLGTELRVEAPVASEFTPGRAERASWAFMPRIPLISSMAATAAVGGDVGASSDEGPLQELARLDLAPPMVAVPSHVEWGTGQLRTVQVDVIELDDLTEEIRLERHAIGLIARAGRIFVAQTGTRWDRAEECGQYLLWDKAAAIVVAHGGQRLKAVEADPGRGSENMTFYSAGLTGQGSIREHSFVREMFMAGGPRW
jgi:hypothetical protein